MNKFIFVLFLNGCLAMIANAQKVDYPLNNRVIINYPDRIVYAYFDTEKKAVSVQDELFYHWYSANDIKKTRGGYDGKILHGVYTEYYNNRSLKEKGMFRYGLRKGRWKTWYSNGELKDAITYKKGVKNGKFITYYPNGQVHEKGTYSKDLLHNKYSVNDSSGYLIKTFRYKKGKVKQEKQSLFHKFRKKNTDKKKRIKATPATEKEDKEKIKDEPKDVSPAIENKKVKEGKKKEEKVNKNSENKKKEKGENKKKDKVKVRKIKKIVPADGGTNSI